MTTNLHGNINRCSIGKIHVICSGNMELYVGVGVCVHTPCKHDKHVDEDVI